MTIPQSAWNKYIVRLRRLSDRAAADIIKYINAQGGLQFVDARELIDYAYGIATRYGEATAALACEMYDAVALAEGATVAAAVPAETATMREIATAINGTLKTGNPEIVASSIGRQVKMSGVDTTIHNAIRDRAEFAWIPQGETCAFCIALASRGWQPASKAALKGDHAEHIHANCDCTYAIRFSPRDGVAGYNPEKYREMYYGADGDTPEERINALRREAYAENSEEINAKKRDNYEKRKEREADTAEEILV